jgi:hypothetical protein
MGVDTLFLAKITENELISVAMSVRLYVAFRSLPNLREI